MPGDGLMFGLNLDCREPPEHGDSSEGKLPMPMTLQPEHERLIAEALRSGAYEDSGEVVNGRWSCSATGTRGSPRTAPESMRGMLPPSVEN